MRYLYLLVKSAMFPGTLSIRWETATVVVLPKTLKPESATSKYRSISLLSAVGKVGDAVLLRCLKEVAEAWDALPECQFGFQQGHSTPQQPLRLTEWTTHAVFFFFFFFILTLRRKQALSLTLKKHLVKFGMKVYCKNCARYPFLMAFTTC
jgi:hypothetical protein